ncbi:MAG: ribosome hibernation-promoting factor, HPF/YfiA family [Gemmatimonadota bacterium]
MHVILSARHCEIGDELRDLIQRRLDHLERFEPRASRAEVTVTAERLRYAAEALVSVDGDERIHGRADADDVRTAVDRLCEKLRRQLRKRHGRRRDHQAPSLGELGAPGGVPEAEEEGLEPGEGRLEPGREPRAPGGEPRAPAGEPREPGGEPLEPSGADS